MAVTAARAVTAAGAGKFLFHFIALMFIFKSTQRVKLTMAITAAGMSCLVFISFYYTNIYFRSTQHIETAMAAALARIRDVLSLEFHDSHHHDEVVMYRTIVVHFLYRK